MKRSLLVAAGTAAGVTAVVSYHATSATSSPALPSAAHTTATRSATTTTAASTGAASTTAARTTTAAARTSRSAVGESVPFQYGELQVRVTERAGRITGVSFVSFQVNDSHSQSIDQVAVPELEQQVIAAQSAHIDGVSGASYTSQAYEQSVQSALDKL